MTQKKDLKRRVRDRMEKTGERYAAALRQVKAKVEPELEADSYRLEAPGIRCQLMASRAIYRRVLDDRGARLVVRFEAVVRALESDPTAVLFQRAVSGEPAEPFADARVAVLRWSERVAERARYARRLELGLRGISSDGCILAFDLDGELVVASLAFFPGQATISLESKEDFRGASELAGLERLLPFRAAR